jgi:hypothetical protein
MRQEGRRPAAGGGRDMLKHVRGVWDAEVLLQGA